MHMRVLGWLPVQNKFDAAELEELRELKNDIERKDKQQAGIIENQVRCQMLRARTHKHTHTHITDGPRRQARMRTYGILPRSRWAFCALCLPIRPLGLQPPLGFLCSVSANVPIGSATSAPILSSAGPPLQLL